MADTKNTITINFKAVNAPQLKKAIESLDKATKSLINSQVKLAKEGKKVKDVQDDLNKSTKKTSSGFFDLGHSARNGTDKLNGLGGAFSVLRSKLLLFNFAMGLGIRQVGKLVSEASKVEAMRTAFETLSGESDALTISLKKITEATNGTMSEFDLFQQANNAMILGVTQNSDEMAEMFDIAQRLGRALGKDTAQSVESLITGIGRQSRLMLDNIGIIVKSEEAYEKYAKKLNKTTDELTDAEKKQAFLEATMDSAREKVKSLGEEILTTRDVINQFTASSENLSVAVGELLAPSFGELAKESTIIIKNLTELAKIMGHSKGVNLTYAEALEQTPKIIKKYSEAHNIAIDSTKSLEFQLQQLMEALSLDVKEGGFFGDAETKNALARTEDAYTALTKAVKDFYDSALPEGERPPIDFKFEVTDVDVALKELGEELHEMTFGENLFEGMTFPDIEEFIAEQDAEFEFFENLRVERAKQVAEELKAIEEKISDDAKQLAREREELAKEKEDVRKAVFGETTQFQLKELFLLEKKFLEHFEHTLESEKFFAEERKKIAKNTAEEIKRLSIEKQKIKDLNMLAGAINTLSGAFDVLRDSQASASAKMSAFLRMAGGLLSIFGQGTPTGAFGGVLSALGGAIGHTGGYIKQDGSIQRFATGGMVRGKDNVPIMAQAGEFIIRKAVVEQVGVDNLAKLNRGESGVGNTININISGGIVDESYVNNELIPALNKASSLGNRINA